MRDAPPDAGMNQKELDVPTTKLVLLRRFGARQSGRGSRGAAVGRTQRRRIARTRCVRAPWHSISCDRPQASAATPFPTGSAAASESPLQCPPDSP